VINIAVFERDTPQFGGKTITFVSRGDVPFPKLPGDNDRVPRHQGRRLGVVEDLREAHRQRQDRESWFYATASGFIARLIFGVTDSLPGGYRWPVAIAIAALIFVGLGLLDTRYLLTRRRPRHGRPDHRR
jgi:hypothetical protein